LELSVTVTLATGRPCWSATVPRIVPVWTPCAAAPAPKQKTAIASHAATKARVRVSSSWFRVFVAISCLRGDSIAKTNAKPSSGFCVPWSWRGC